MTQTGHPREELKQIIEGDKPVYVKELFDSIADGYDRMNRIMTGGLLSFWHRSFSKQTKLQPGGRALDICCGTGDLTFIQARRVRSEGAVIGLDFSPNMLNLARSRQASLEEKQHIPNDVITWVEGDALNLPFVDGTESTGFDCVTMGFALRNVNDVAKSISEMARVAKNNGRVIVLEVSWPDNALLRFGFNIYFFKIVPIIGRMAEKRLPEDSPLKKLRPYTYLPYSLEHLPQPSAILDIFRDAGLKNVRRVPLTGGIVSLYIGEKLL